MLTLALSLPSCRGVKETSSEKSRSSLTVHQDSSYSRTLDSIVTRFLQQRISVEHTATEEADCTTVLFDTDKPVSPETGLPPVKAMSRQRKHLASHDRKDAGSSLESTHTTNAALTGVTHQNVKAKEQDKSLTTVHKTEGIFSSWKTGFIMGIVVFLIVCVIIKLKKIKIWKK